MRLFTKKDTFFVFPKDRIDSFNHILVLSSPTYFVLILTNLIYIDFPLNQVSTQAIRITVSENFI